LVLYADWEIIVYTINYYLNGGVNNIRNPKSFTVEDRPPVRRLAFDGNLYYYLSISNVD